MLFAIISVLLQVGIVFVIVAAIWAVFGRRVSFAAYTGLTMPPVGAILLAGVLGAALAAAMLSVPALREAASGPDTIPAQTVAQMGKQASLAALILFAIFKTAFSEELFFRGLIGKRLIAWLGFGVGNVLQALIFGAVHLALLMGFEAKPSLPVIVGITLFTAAFGWLNGWLNEKKGDGSILPGWTAHAVINLIAYFFVAFYIL